MSIRKYITITLCLFCLAFRSSPIHAAEKLEPVTIQFKWFHQFQFAGYFAAVEKGFYAEDGLDVKLRAYAGDLANATSPIKHHELYNLKVVASTPFESHNQAMGVRKNWPELAAIINKGIKAISAEQRIAIKQEWADPVVSATSQAISLTPEEQAWISEHPVVKIGIGDSWAPFVYKRSDGNLEGYDVDFLTRINELIGANIRLVAGPWKDIVEQAERREIDGLAESAVVERRAEYFQFTDPYNVVQYAAATLPEKAAGVRIASDLRGKRIAHLKGNAWTRKIIASIGEVQIIEAGSEEEAFRFVVEGKADFALIPVHLYAPLRAVYHDALAIAHVFRSEEHILKTVYSIRKDWPELVSIINKALSAIGNREKQAIFEKWVPEVKVSAEPALPRAVQFDINKFLLESLGAVFGCIAVIIFIAWLVKGRPKQLSIRDSLILISFVFAALIATSAAFVILLIQTHEHEDAIRRWHLESLYLAFELKQSSDDLTRFARTYAMTGNQRYERYYWTIVATRDGKQAHPKNFTPFYWDYVAAGVVEPDQDGEIYSIEQRMINLGLSEEEMSKLSEAKKESDDLINLENTAMNAVKGLYRDDDGRFTIKGVPDMTMARNLLHGKEYHDAKARIMRPIEQFFTLLKWRITNEENQLHRRNEAIILAITILVAITIGFSIYVFFLMRRRIIFPLVAIEEGAQTIKEGNYSHYIDLTSSDEIGALAAAFNSMARSIEEKTSRLQATIESTTDGILVVDLKQKITSYNDKVLDIWRIEREQAKAADDDTVLLEMALEQMEDPDAFMDRVKYLYNNPEEEDFSILSLRDGRILERYSKPQWIGDRVIGRVWSFRDVTEKRNDELMLRKSEQRLKRTQAIAKIGYWDLDLLNNELSWSDELYQIFGIQPQKFLATYEAFIECVHPDDRELVNKAYTDSIDRKQKEYEIEHRIVRKDTGEVRYIFEKCQHEKNDSGAIVRSIGMAQDITDRVIAAGELRKLSRAIEASPSLVVITDIDGTIEYVNPKFSQVTGYTAEEAIGQNPRILKSGKHSPEFYREMWDTLTNGKEWRGEIENKRKDGRHYWEHAAISPIINTDGKIINYVSVKEDITERRKEQEAFREVVEGTAKVTGEAFFQNLVKHLAKGLGMRYALVVELLQHDGSRARTLAVWANGKLVPNFEYDLASTPSKNIVNQGACFYASGVRELFPNDQMLVEMDVESYVGCPLINAEGQTLGFLAVLDTYSVIENPLITSLLEVFSARATSELERKHFEKIIETQAKRMRALHEVVTNSGLSDEETIVGLLKKGCQLLEVNVGVISRIEGNDYFIEQAYGMEAGKHLHLGDTLCGTVIHNNQTLMISHASKSEFRDHPAVRNRGVKSYIATPLWIDNRLYGTVRFSGPTRRKEPYDDSDKDFIEVTSQLIGVIKSRMEFDREMAKAKEQAEVASRIKSEFLANMSHEIRTPLHSVLGFLELVLEDSSLNDQHWKHLSTAQRSASNLLGVINDILDISKLESGKLTIEQRPFRVSQLMHEIQSTMDIAAYEKGLYLKLDIQPSISGAFIGDPLRLRQILMNLVGNGIKFTEEGGVFIRVMPAEEEGHLHFMIDDTGIGIPADRLSQIFQPFTQADSTTTRRYGGTGLGTTIAKELVELMGGRIWAESKEGKGSTFHFTINIPSTDQIPEDGDMFIVPGKAVLPSVRRGFRILLVEDVEANVDLAKIRLAQQDHEVTVALNGIEAVNAFELEEFDVILMDIQMPMMGGLEATERIRAIESSTEGRRVPIIAMTAAVMQEETEKYLGSGMDAVVAKPIDFGKLFKTMEVVVSKGVGKVVAKAQEDVPTSYDLEFPPLDGIDAQKALQTWQNPELYVKALLGFSRDYNSAAAELSRLIDEGDIDSAYHIAHTLKGVAGNLSITEVAAAVEHINAALKEKRLDDVMEYLTSLAAALKAAIDSIGQLETLQDVKDMPKKEMDVAHLTELFIKMLAAFDKFSPYEIEPFLHNLKEYLSQDQLNPIVKHMERFDFDGAKQETVKLVKTLKIDLEGYSDKR